MGKLSVEIQNSSCIYIYISSSKIYETPYNGENFSLSPSLVLPVATRRESPHHVQNPEIPQTSPFEFLLGSANFRSLRPWTLTPTFPPLPPRIQRGKAVVIRVIRLANLASEALRFRRLLEPATILEKRGWQIRSNIQAWWTVYWKSAGEHTGKLSIRALLLRV